MAELDGGTAERWAFSHSLEISFSFELAEESKEFGSGALWRFAWDKHSIYYQFGPIGNRKRGIAPADPRNQSAGSDRLRAGRKWSHAGPRPRPFFDCERDLRGLADRINPSLRMGIRPMPTAARDVDYQFRPPTAAETYELDVERVFRTGFAYFWHQDHGSIRKKIRVMHEMKTS